MIRFNLFAGMASLALGAVSIVAVNDGPADAVVAHPMQVTTTQTTKDCPTQNTGCAEAEHNMPYCWRANCWETSPVVIVSQSPIKVSPIGGIGIEVE